MNDDAQLIRDRRARQSSREGTKGSVTVLTERFAQTSSGQFAACRHVPLHLPDSLVRELETAYADPQRAYHNAAHVAAVLASYDEVADAIEWERAAEVYVAILFHDAVYVPGARDNEARSAAWAQRAGLPVDGDRVAALIELTARHGSLGPSDVDRDAALFLDCDTAILGAAPDVFDTYDAAIAREYSSLPADVYRAGRRAFLARLATAPRIFLSDYFHARLDGAARANIARALTPSEPPT
jgi:predicted metal-dependent HD superfamily phosphohydrolase